MAVDGQNLCNAGVTTQGVAESFLSASLVTRTRRAHQVTAVSLHILMNKAYMNIKPNQERISKRTCFRKKSGKMK